MASVRLPRPMDTGRLRQPERPDAPGDSGAPRSGGTVSSPRRPAVIAPYVMKASAKSAVRVLAAAAMWLIVLAIITVV
jgi:hypothetical protein